MQGSFGMMVWHWLPVVILACVWVGIFAVNMIMKEASMSRYPEWASYSRRSWWLIPLVLQTSAVSRITARQFFRLVP